MVKFSCRRNRDRHASENPTRGNVGGSTIDANGCHIETRASKMFARSCIVHASWFGVPYTLWICSGWAYWRWENSGIWYNGKEQRHSPSYSKGAVESPTT